MLNNIKLLIIIKLVGKFNCSVRAIAVGILVNVNV